LHQISYIFIVTTGHVACSTALTTTEKNIRLTGNDARYVTL